MSEDKLFVTKDIELAVFFKAKDVKIIDIRRDEWNKMSLVFDNSDGTAQQLRLQFYNHEDDISASKLLSSFGQIKQILHDPNTEKRARTRV